jgi:hypothetical protein
LDKELQEINKITAIVNFFLTLSGWGLKDFLFKESVKPFSDFQRTWQLAFDSKILLSFPIIIVLSLWLKSPLLILVNLVFLLKTFNTLYDPLIVALKRARFFFLIDFLVLPASIVLIGFKVITNATQFFVFIAVLECVKSVLYKVIFKLPTKNKVNFAALISFLKSTKFYFLLVLLSFFQSKIDLYLLGFLLKPEEFNVYQLLSSLLSMVQILFTTFVVSYTKLLYRNIKSSAAAFTRIVFRSGYLAALFSTPAIYFVLRFIYHFDFGYPSMLLAALNTLCFAFVLHEMFYYSKNERLDWVLRYVALAGTLNFILGFVFISRFSVAGALFSNTAGLFLLAVLLGYTRTIESKHKTTG